MLILWKRSLANILAGAALTVGIFNTHGAMPSFSPEFMALGLRDENFLALPFIGVCMMIGAQNLALYLPLTLHAFLQSGRTL